MLDSVVTPDVACAPTTEHVAGATLASDVTQWAHRLVSELSVRLPVADVALLKSQAETVAAEPIALPRAADPMKPLLVRDTDALATLVTHVSETSELVIDIETSSLDQRNGEIVGIGFAIPDTTYYLPINHRFEASRALRPAQLPLYDVLASLSLQDKHLIAHNAKFESKWLQYHGGIECYFEWDTMIAARLLRSDLPASLKMLVQRELDVPDWGLPDTEMRRIQFLPVETVASYCAKDCWYTLMLYRRQLACLV